MKNIKPSVLIGAISAIIVVMGLFYTLNKNYESSPSNKVAATIFPLYDIVRNVAGNEIETVLILTPGASPHTFDPSPKEIKALNGSKILFAIGHGLDNWAFKMTEAVGVEKTVIVDKYIDLLEGGHDHHNNEHDNDHKSTHGHGENHAKDPHYWLTAGNAIKIAQSVKEELSLIFPEKSEAFEENFKNYSQKLQSLDEKIIKELSAFDNPPIATFHNAWSYFARGYPVNLVTVFEEFPGKEPTPKYIAEFKENIIKNNVKVIFSEPQFSPLALQPIAKDLGVIFSELDPLGGVEERKTYEELMIYNVNQIITTLQ